MNIDRTRFIPKDIPLTSAYRADASRNIELVKYLQMFHSEFDIELDTSEEDNPVIWVRDWSGNLLAAAYMNEYLLFHSDGSVDAMGYEEFHSKYKRV